MGMLLAPAAVIKTTNHLGENPGGTLEQHRQTLAVG